MKRLALLSLLLATPALAQQMPSLIHTPAGTYQCPPADAIWTDREGVPHAQNTQTGESHECTKVAG